jgi:peptidoglycan/xylan/chitin deacetylase (PgdA/CDA1 family)
MEVLQAQGGLLRLHDLTRSLVEGTLSRRAVAVTFDDGYADNLHAARPLLERYEIPATFFLAAGYLGSGREFWWDALERLMLHPTDWKEEPMEEIAIREQRYYKVWEQLYFLPDREKWSLLNTMFNKQGIATEARPTHRILSKVEVATLAAERLVEIGAHTMTHPVLAQLPVAEQGAEIRASKTLLEELINHPVQGFSYPHGHYTSATVTLVREAGFSNACTTSGGVVDLSTDCLALPRVQVPNIDGDAFSQQLRAWSEATG